MNIQSNQSCIKSLGSHLRICSEVISGYSIEDWIAITSAIRRLSLIHLEWDVFGNWRSWLHFTPSPDLILDSISSFSTSQALGALYADDKNNRLIQYGWVWTISKLLVRRSLTSYLSLCSQWLLLRHTGRQTRSIDSLVMGRFQKNLVKTILLCFFWSSSIRTSSRRFSSFNPFFQFLYCKRFLCSRSFRLPNYWRLVHSNS